MAEALGAGAAGMQLFETAIVVFKRVSAAYKHQKELTAVLDKYGHVLETIKVLAGSVRNEKALETANVSEPLTRLRELEGKLCSWLAKVEPGDKTALRLFAGQLVHGQADRKKLDDIMRDLYRVKHDLSLVISMHQVRVSHDISQAVSTKSSGAARSQKPKKSRRTDGEANATVPTGARTKAQLNDSRISSTDSEDDDTSTDASSEGSRPDEPAFVMPQGQMIRRTIRNKAKRGATMVNAPVGKVDLWKHVDVVEIEDNECEEDAEMYNYMNDEHGMELARKARNVRIAEKREQMLWEKENGFRPS